ncbi:hypothetical protein BJY01DRAFT_206749 [Aspergillus pseudoustus]|uniref:SMP-30/Gluconolactonase/LRE-like region domain-containing protein n=1 Tax=Aspergillus pseudoustus TaxID=1810923 RepID=A0ABR4KMH0_9EURO
MSLNTALRRGLWLPLFLRLAFALPSNASRDYPLVVVGEFSHPETFENIATRHDGQLLLTSAVSSTLYQVCPFKPDQIEGLVDIPETTGLFGIAELEEDVFYVASANLSSTHAVAGSNAVWRVDLRERNRCSRLNETARPELTPVRVANITSARLLNGMCRLAKDNASTLLVADSGGGKIFKVDVHSGSFEVVIEDEALGNTPTGFQVAVNGIYTHEPYLYFTNLNRGTFGRIPISAATGILRGPIDVIVPDLPGDDFILAPDGEKAWVAMNGRNTLVEVDIPRRQARVVVESGYLASASAVSLGRTLLDQGRLYVSSAAVPDSLFDNNGTATTRGIVVRVDPPNV